MRTLRWILAVALAVTVALAVPACGDSPSTTATTVVAPTGSTTSSTAAAPPSSSTSEGEATTTSAATGQAGSDGGGSADDPLPFGQEATVGDWTVVVVETTFNANEVVANHNEFNQPPEEGSQYVLVKVRVNGPADLPAVFGDGLYAVLLGSGGNAFDTAPVEVPDSIRDAGEIAAGASVTGNLVFQAFSDEVDGAVLVLEPMGAGEVYLALK